MKAKHFLTIIIAVITLFALCMIPCGAENEQPTLDKKTFREIYRSFWGASISLYDVNGHQHYGDMVEFDTDSNGIPYADGKKFTYICFENTDISGNYDYALDIFMKCMTPELAKRMAEDYHVPGGPDVEFVRQESDGKWYKLSLLTICPCYERDITEIVVDGTNARVKFIGEFTALDLMADNAAHSQYITDEWTVELVYTEDGWKMSGGNVFDFTRDYAATSPYTSDENGTRAAILAVTAAVAAVLQAVILTVSRRRRRAV